MKVLTVVGNRPQFVKAAAVSRHLRRQADEVLVHSGQHYDQALSEVFFAELELPRPDHMLGVGSGSHAVQTAATMAHLEPLMEAERPDLVLVYGDTNTTAAAALVAAKLPLPVAHVEAGMRSFDLSMPEEANRVLVDSISQLLLCPTEAAMLNLEAEGLAERARLVGDPQADLALELGPLAEERSDVLDRLGLIRGEYLVATLHRAGTVDEERQLARATELLFAVGERYGPVLVPLHPRTHARLEATGLDERLRNSRHVRLIEPLGYLDFSCLLRGARAVLTDSGGVQKEAYLAGVPCVTLRSETEWVETAESGWNRLVGLDLKLALAALDMLLTGLIAPPDPGVYAAGVAGERCVEALLEWAASAS